MMDSFLKSPLTPGMTQQAISDMSYFCPDWKQKLYHMVLWSGKTYSRASVGALHAHTDNIYICCVSLYQILLFDLFTANSWNSKFCLFSGSWI